MGGAAVRTGPAHARARVRLRPSRSPSARDGPGSPLLAVAVTVAALLGGLPRASDGCAAGRRARLLRPRARIFPGRLPQLLRHAAPVPRAATSRSCTRIVLARDLRVRARRRDPDRGAAADRRRRRPRRRRRRGRRRSCPARARSSSARCSGRRAGGALPAPRAARIPRAVSRRGSRSRSCSSSSPRSASTSDSVAKGAFLAWQGWDPYDQPDDPVGVRYVWNSHYRGIHFPEQKTTVLTVKTEGRSDSSTGARRRSTSTTATAGWSPRPEAQPDVEPDRLRPPRASARRPPATRPTGSRAA